MKITIEKQNIEHAVKKLSRLANGKSNMEILNFIKLESCEDGSLQLTANDTTKTLSERIEYEGGEVATCLRGPKLAKAVASFGDGEIQIVQDATTTKLKQGRSQIKVDALPADQFPDYELPDSGWTDANISASVLSGAIKTVQHAMPQKDVRHELNGVYLTEGYAVATDGHRLARCPIDYQGHPVIIPTEAVGHIVNGQGHAYSCETQFRVASITDQIVTRVVDRKYPDWERLFFDEGLTRLTCDRQALSDAIKRAMIGGENVRLVSDSSNGVLTVCNDGASTEIDAQSDDDIRFTSRAEYLDDVLGAVTDDNIRMRVNSDGRSQAFINDDFIVMGIVE